jgi:LPS-assembly protein
MGRSVDQTFYADHYSKIGWGFGHELRYAADQPSRGTFRTYAIKPTDGRDWDYDFDWNALQMLPGRFRATLSVRQYSDLLFQQQFQDNFNMATTRTRRSAVNIQRAFGTNQFSLAADSMARYFGTSTRMLEHLPSVAVRKFPQKIGRSGLTFGYEARAERLGFGEEDAVERFSRFDIAPQVSYPLSTTFLQVTPQATFRYTRYSATYDNDLDSGIALDGPSLDRPFFEGGLDVRGPTFSRVFDVGGGYTDRIKHTIGPEMNWLYRTRVDDFESIPKYDGTDYLLGTNEIQYALVQRFLAKRPGPTGKSIPHEFLSIRVGQTYYVQIADGQNSFDPNYASSAFGPGYTPAHLSPILTRVRVRPVPGITGDFNVYYDVNFKQLSSLFFSGGVNGTRGSLLAGWSRVMLLAENPEERITTANTVRGNASFQLIPNRLTVDGGANYDFVRKELLHSRGRIRLDVQCCGFMAEVIQYSYNLRQERQFRFSIELANVGSMGNFMDEDSPGRRQGLGGGYR